MYASRKCKHCGAEPELAVHIYYATYSISEIITLTCTKGLLLIYYTPGTGKYHESVVGIVTSAEGHE